MGGIMKLAYCDYIADRIRHFLNCDLKENRLYTLISEVGKVKMDLHPTEGYFQSTKKVIEVTDINSKRYRITVEEI